MTRFERHGDFLRVNDGKVLVWFNLNHTHSVAYDFKESEVTIVPANLDDFNCKTYKIDDFMNLEDAIEDTPIVGDETLEESV